MGGKIALIVILFVFLSFSVGLLLGKVISSLRELRALNRLYKESHIDEDGEEDNAPQ